MRSRRWWITCAWRLLGNLLGETLNCLPRSSELLVLSTWQTIEDWNHWFEHPVRLRLQQEMDVLLSGQTVNTIYQDI